MKYILALGLAVGMMGCGVKGRPLPPLSPPEIGRGRPDNSSGFEELAIPVVPPANPTPAPGR